MPYYRVLDSISFDDNYCCDILELVTEEEYINSISHSKISSECCEHFVHIFTDLDQYDLYYKVWFSCDICWNKIPRRHI